MKYLIIYSVLIIFLLIENGLTTNPPKWDDTYTTKGTLFIPYAEIVEPFYGWYDKPTGRSRIDYYGGMVKTYQLVHDGDFGSLLKIAPVTTDDVLNKVTCLQVNGTQEDRVQVQSILPDPKNFKYEGTEELYGMSCDRFVLEEVIGQKKNAYTLWVRYKKSPKYPASRMPIPVRYEMKGYNNVLKSHYDHYYMNYDHYSHEDIPNEIFEVDMSDPCIGFPGPGNRHFATFNPMSEFLHPHNDEHIENEFERFKTKHDRQYKHEIEHEKRKIVFMQNLRFIHSINRQKLGYSLAINHLTDKTDNELSALRGYRRSVGVYNGGQPFPYRITDKILADLPDQYDWRLFGAVTPVKDQSVCGSCWSFGTIGAIEGAYFLKNGENLVRLSQQALVDCSWGYGNNGCDGGEDWRAYQWMIKQGGVPTEADYGPYIGQDGYCHVQNVSVVAPITGYVNVTRDDPNAMKIALLNNGPISVAIDASPKTFSFYSHGVYYEPKCKNDENGLDHAVLAVGYGTMNGELYWLVKNSWSNHWGNDGYILMSARNNNCGVMTTPTYVKM